MKFYNIVNHKHVIQIKLPYIFMLNSIVWFEKKFKNIIVSMYNVNKHVKKTPVDT